MPEIEAPVGPLEPALKTLLLPEIVAKLVLGAKTKTSESEVLVSFEGDAIRLSKEDFHLCARVASRVKEKMPVQISMGACIRSVLMAQQYVSEEIFRPGAVRVLFYSTVSVASAWYRCMMPSYALGQGSKCMSHVTTGKYTRAALDYDVVVFQIDHSPGARQFAKALKDAGKKIVYEIDDAFDCLESWHSSYASMGIPERQESIREMMHLADAVQVSTPWLADHYRKDCELIKVIPNMIELASWPKAPKSSHDGLFKVVWAGSPSHSGDLAVAIPALAKFAQAHQDVRIVMFGQNLTTTDIPVGQLENLPWVDNFAEYPFKLSEIDADVSVAPLADIKFNLGKSNLRILQMWATGYPVIASAIGPYKDTITQGVDGILCQDEAGWLEALERLYQNKASLHAFEGNGIESVKAYDVHPNIHRIEEFYSSLVGRER